ncbi:MAG: glycosyltransferase [Phycisphaerae bacterium]|nr:glycosyltransferase [Phycisphaerae bacterium]
MAGVMHLVSTFQTKTDTKWLVRLLERIDRKEFPTVVGAFYDDGPVRGQFQTLGIETFCLNLPRVWDIRALWRLMRMIDRYKPDIVHTHLLRADLYGGLAGKLRKKCVISTVYAYGDYRRAHRRAGWDWLLDRASTVWADRFIAVCETIREDMKVRLGISHEQIDVIHTGLDPLTSNPAKVAERRASLGMGENEKVVLVGARLSYEKGVDCFLRAVKVLADRGVKARFLVAGHGPMEHELRELASELGLSETVRFLGFVSDLEILIEMADVVVMPSYAEGLPNVALETFGAARPLVASRVGGLVDLSMINKEAILLTKPKNYVDLADKIQTILKDSVLAERMSLAGRTILEKQLSTVQVARRYEETYRKTCRK